MVGMGLEKPQLFATLRNPETLEVRRILILPKDGALMSTELSGKSEQVLGTGRTYEMQELSQAAVERLCTDGFKLQKEEQVFEPLDNIIELALKLGYTIIYDPEVKTDLMKRRGVRLPNNLTGEQPLSLWPGRLGKNGAPYEYAFGRMKIYAQPKILHPPELRTAPPGGKEFAAFLSKIMSLRNEIGPFREFLIAGDR